jgi:hypothetical protein
MMKLYKISFVLMIILGLTLSLPRVVSARDSTSLVLPTNAKAQHFEVRDITYKKRIIPASPRGTGKVYWISTSAGQETIGAGAKPLLCDTAAGYKQLSRDDGPTTTLVTTYTSMATVIKFMCSSSCASGSYCTTGITYYQTLSISTVNDQATVVSSKEAVPFTSGNLYYNEKVMYDVANNYCDCGFHCNDFCGNYECTRQDGNMNGISVTSTIPGVYFYETDFDTPSNTPSLLTCVRQTWGDNQGVTSTSAPTPPAEPPTYVLEVPTT